MNIKQMAESLLRQWYARNWHGTFSDPLQRELWVDAQRQFAAAQATDWLGKPLEKERFTDRFNVTYNLIFIRDMLRVIDTRYRSWQGDLPIEWAKRIDNVIEYFQGDPLYEMYDPEQCEEEDRFIVWEKYTVTVKDLGGPVPLMNPTKVPYHTLPGTSIDESKTTFSDYAELFFQLCAGGSGRCDDELIAEFKELVFIGECEGWVTYNAWLKYTSWMQAIIFFSKANGVRCSEAIKIIGSWSEVRS